MGQWPGTGTEGGANGQDERRSDQSLFAWEQCCCCPDCAPRTPRSTVVEAVWKPQRINFVYRGYSTLYSCSGLQDKLEKILTTVGARDRVELRAYSCDDALSIARFQIALASPVEATPENVQELTTYDARDELIARVRGEQLVSAEDLQRFPAVWKTISFARSREMPAGARRLRAGATAAPARAAAHVGADRQRPRAVFGVRQHQQAAAHGLGAGAGGAVAIERDARRRICQYAHPRQKGRSLCVSPPA